MKKKNVILLYKDKNIPEGLLAAVESADENDLRLMLSLTLLSASDKADAAPLAEKLGMSESELDASIKYWCGAGLIKKSRDTTAAKDKKDESRKTEAKSTAHKEGKLERSGELPSYSSDELSELIEKRRVTAEFIDEAQRIIGKVFNTHEIGILVGIVDYIGFDESSVIVILSEMIKNDKRSIRYAEKLAFALYDMGITTADGLHDYFRAEEENKKTESLVRAMFGMSGRALTSTESKYLKAWISKMGYGVEVIRLAYDITVDIKHEPIPAYANAILKKWNELGLHTENEVKAYLEESKKQKGDAKKEDAKNGASFDTEDFFDAALRRTFDEL